MAELWQFMLSRNNGSAAPKFSAETEDFINAPQAVTYLMDEFNSTMRFIYIDAGNFATNLDLATKIWQAVTQINFTELLPIFDRFSTSLLVSILEYLLLFALGLKSNNYSDIAEYIMRMAHSIINAVVYARDGTNDTLAPELTLQFNISLAFVVTYYRFSANYSAAKATAQLIFELYEQNKHKGVFSKDYEARMCIRKVLHTDSTVDHDKYMERVKELGEEGVMNPSLYYYLYYHLSFMRLISPQDLQFADTCIQKAEYYINWHVDQSPPEVRDQVRDLFDCKLHTIHAEIAARLGDIDLAKKKVGGLIQIYSRVAPPAKRLMAQLLGFGTRAYQKHRLTWSFDYYSLLNIADAAMDHRALPIGEADSNDVLIEIDSMEDETHSANEAPLSFDELLMTDPNLDLDLDPSYDGFMASLLDNSSQYTIT
jgi:hypothetical protein